ncbi:MAG: hypothetical protein QOJ53_2063 [Sphingomonadales bacterium]|jgi:hypothetical protein|nr:hypothetical protein [Sphingomonadales bacterium]
MSPSEPEGGQGLLRVQGPPAVRIEIIDGGFRKIAEGSELIELPLPEGIYTARWSGPSGTEEQNIRLFPSDEPVLLRGGFGPEKRVEKGPPSLGVSLLIQQIVMLPVRLFKFLAPIPADNSRLSIIVEPSEGKIHSNPARSLRLFAADGTPIEPVAQGRGRGRAGKKAHRYYKLAPGAYRLRFQSAEQRMVEQTICTFPAAQTTLFMRYGRAYEMRLRGSQVVRTPLRGIDPSATIAASLELKREGIVTPGLFSIQQALLQGLAGRSAPIDDLFVRMLSANVDPYLKLFASTLLLQQASRRESEPQPDAAGADHPDPLAAARQILDSMPDVDCPDLQCLRWKLGDQDVAPVLSCPPMLAQCWQWAIEWSAAHPGAVPAGGAFDAAADSRSSYMPWVVWSAADVRRPAPPEPFDAALLERRMAEINQGMGEIYARWGEDSALLTGGGQLDLPILSDASFRLVDDLARVRLLTGTDSGKVLSARDLITNLGIPAQTLLLRADTALGEIRTLTENWSELVAED